MLANNVNDNAKILNERGVLKFFASKLAPTNALTEQHYGKYRAFLYVEDLLSGGLLLKRAFAQRRQLRQFQRDQQGHQ